MTPSEYEFSSSQNELIGDLAKKMNFVGMLLIAVGIVTIVTGLINLSRAFSTPQASAIVLGNVIQGVFSLLIGLWTRSAAQAFKQIVTTAGADIENLMMALGELRKLYTLQYWLFIIGFIFILATLVFAVILVILAGG